MAEHDPGSSDEPNGWSLGGQRPTPPDASQPPGVTPPGSVPQAPPLNGPGQYPATSSDGGSATKATSQTPWGNEHLRPAAVGGDRVVPLRPLNLGQLYEAAYKVLRFAPVPLIGGYILALIISAIVAIAILIAGTAAAAALFAALGPSMTFDSAADVNFPMAILLTIVVGLGIAMAALPQYLPMAGLTWAASEAALGQKPKVGEVVKKSLQAIPAMLVWMVLAAILVPLAFGTVIVLFVLIGAELPVVAQVILGIIGFMVLVAMSTALLACTWFLVPAWAVEGHSPMGAIARSIKLALRNLLPVLGVALLTNILTAIVASVLVVPVQLLVFVGESSLTDASGELQLAGAVTSNLAVLAVSWVASALVYPFLGAVWALHLLDQRMRFEGLDVKLAAALEKEVPDVPKAREVLREKP